jgi:hypothetical protein
LVNAISDPLGTILQAFLGFFDPYFLAFALISGYLMFFLFFYGTKKWQTLDWVERFFFGFLTGFLTAILAVYLAVPITFIFTTIGLPNFTFISIYIAPICLLGFLTIIRADRGPLYSEKFTESFSNYLATEPTKLPLILLILSLVCIVGIFLNNPLFPSASFFDWLYFFLWLNTGLFIYVVFICNLILYLSSLSKGIKPWNFLSIAFNWYTNFFFAKYFLKIKSKLKTINQQVFSFPKNHLFSVKHKFSWKLITLVLILIIFFSADRSLSLISPSLQLVEKKSSDQIEFYRNYDGSFVYLEKTTSTYFIKLPLLNFKNFNMSIQNPSNLKNDEIKRINTLNLVQMDPQFSSESFLGTLEKDDKGYVSKINIMSTIGASPLKSTANITLTYFNKLNLDLIHTIQPIRSNLYNNSYLVAMQISITNSETKVLVSQRLPLFFLYDFNYLGNLTSSSWTVTGSKFEVSNDFIISDNCLWSPSINVYPNQTVNIKINAVFEESK